jgi:hypothetical protein
MRRRPPAPLDVAGVRALRATLSAFGRGTGASRRAGAADAGGAVSPIPPPSPTTTT